MRLTITRRGLFSTLLCSSLISWAGCGSGGGGGGSTGGGCGAGTHADANGVCQLDPALDVVASQSNSQHWRGTAPYGGYYFYYDLEFTLTSLNTENPAGTGLVKLSSSQPFVWAAPTNVTWYEGPDVASIQFGGGPHGLTEITAIDPNGGAYSATSFTADVTDSFGTLPYTFTLVSGTLPPPGSGPAVIATGQSLWTGGPSGGPNFTGQGLVADATNLYWVTGDGYVRYTSLTGGTVYSLASGLSNTGGFTADANNLYWTGTVAGATGVFKLSKSGGTVGAPIVALNQIAGAASFGTVLSNGSNVYFSVVPMVAGSGDWIASATTSGASPAVIVSSGVTPVLGGAHLAIDSTYVYFVGTGGSLRRAPLAGGSSTVLATGFGGAVAVDSTYAYWFDGTGVQRIPLGGGPTVELVANASNPSAGLTFMAVDSSNVFYGYEPGGGPYVVPISPPSTPATPTDLDIGGANRTGAYAVGATDVFWCDYAAGTIYSVPK